MGFRPPVGRDGRWPWFSVHTMTPPSPADFTYAAFARTDFRPDLKKINIPTLVIHGDSDVIVPFEISGKRTAASIPGAKLMVIKGGPHGINVSHPAEVNQALLAFLSG